MDVGRVAGQVGGVLILEPEGASFEAYNVWDRAHLIEDETWRTVAKVAYVVLSIICFLFVVFDFVVKDIVVRSIKPALGLKKKCAWLEKRHDEEIGLRAEVIDELKQAKVDIGRLVGELRDSKVDVEKKERKIGKKKETIQRLRSREAEFKVWKEDLLETNKKLSKKMGRLSIKHNLVKEERRNSHNWHEDVLEKFEKSMQELNTEIHAANKLHNKTVEEKERLKKELAILVGQDDEATDVEKIEVFFRVIDSVVKWESDLRKKLAEEMRKKYESSQTHHARTMRRLSSVISSDQFPTSS